ncbi:MAG: ATP-binding cassette domain-containing protein, partial [Propionibacteriaceae bacterium]|nr:ATP-binding cassette domain-containing protein [Propionibacteriaceae bacterium]
MGNIEVAHVDYYLPDGRLLLADASFRVGEAVAAALVGPNGAGKSTLLRLISGDVQPDAGIVTANGGLAVMPQFIGSIRDQSSVLDLLLLTAPHGLRAAGAELRRAEQALGGNPDDQAHMRYAQAIADWGDAGGYLQEATWDTCTMAAFGEPFDTGQHRLVNTLSGGEQKRLFLEALFRGDDEVLLLDEPDNYLDVPGKTWLEAQLRATRKTVLFASHDRELLARAAKQIVSVEPAPGGSDVWVHGAGFATYHAARQARFARFDELQR